MTSLQMKPLDSLTYEIKPEVRNSFTDFEIYTPQILPSEKQMQVVAQYKLWTKAVFASNSTRSNSNNEY